MMKRHDNGGQAAARPSLASEFAQAAAQAVISAALYTAGVVWVYRRKRVHDRAIRELRAMPDHLLKDIGLSRGNIEVAVRTGRKTDRAPVAWTPTRRTDRRPGRRFLGL